MKEIDFNLDFESFYCPVTGMQVITPEEFHPSPALVFAFLHPYRLFEHLRKDLKEKFTEDFEDEEKHGELYFKITKEVLKNEQNYLWITHGGPPFGYVSMCFDMEYSDPEKEDRGHPFYDEKSFMDDSEEGL